MAEVSKYKCIIFDFDGTIADTEDINFDIFLQIAKKHNIRTIEKKELFEFKKKSAIEVMKELNIKTYKLPLMIRQGKKILKEKIKNIEPCKYNMAKVLEELKDMNIMLGIITTNSKKNVEKFIDRHNVDYFDFILSSSMFGKESKFKKIMKKNSFDSNQILYVGDEIRDIKAARNVDIEIASVSWGYNEEKSLMKYYPKYLIHEFEELLAVVGI